MSRSRITAVAVVSFTLGVFVYGLLQRPDRTSIASTDAPSAELLPGLGTYRMDAGIKDAGARRWFDQGLVLAYGFNHDAAGRAFLKGAELDPDCGMCWWGAAMVLGPHLNAGMATENAARAWMRLQQAQLLAPRMRARERAFIAALAARYAESPPLDRGPLDEAYVRAMRDLVAKYPADIDARTLLAEALMDLHPWDLYDRTGEPRPWTGEIVALLEQVLREKPDHPGANHFYIHAIEASRAPERGLEAARRLQNLAPGAGHLVHMSSHIYMRTGHYHEATEANLRAIEADVRYLDLCRAASGTYPQGYVPHNHHFLYASSMMEGSSVRAIAAADEVARRMDLERSRQPGYVALQHYWVTRYLARVRFGHWAELLAEPPPPADLPYPTAVWHYAHGMALLRGGRIAEAQRDLEGLATIAAHPDLALQSVWGINSFAALLGLAESQFAGEIALARGHHDAAIAALQSAVEREDALSYDEPSPWYMPARQALGAALLEAGHAERAQTVFEEDLRRNEENGWSLFGLVAALEAQRRPAEEARARLQAAWKHADVKLTAARF
jgi:tetratricopeptide (TPR) repeat protein